MNQQMGDLRQGERLDDLLTNGLKIIQSDEVFSFSLDAVLLAFRFRAGEGENR